MVQVSVVGATVGAILGAIVAPLSLVIMRIAVCAAGGGGSLGQVREVQRGGGRSTAPWSSLSTRSARSVRAKAAAVTMPHAEAGPVHGPEGRRRRRRGPTAAAA